MSPTQQDVEIHGTVRPQVQTQLSEHLNAKTGEAKDGSAVLLDAGDSGFDAAHLRAAVDEGRLVVVVDPTPAASETIMELSGAGVTDARVVAVSRDAAGQYRMGSVGGAPTTETKSFSEEGAPKPPQALLGRAGHESLGADVAGLIESLSKPAPPKLLKAGLGLLGPPGSASGTLAINQPFSGTMGPIGKDFPRATGKTQSFHSSCDNMFHVYYVDGANPPYYLVILRQKLLFSAGPLAINEGCNRGLGMFHAASEVRDVKVNSGTVQLIDYSPNTGTTRADVTQQMNIRQNATGGKQVLPFTANEYEDLVLPEWSVEKRSSWGPTSAGWRFVQSNLYNGMGDITQTLFNDQTVKPFTQISQSTLSATTYAVWRVAGSNRPIFSVGLELVQHFMLVANGGCRDVDWRGASIVYIGTGVPRYDLDLAKISKAPF